MSRTFDAVPDAVERARTQVADFAAAAGAPPPLVDAIRLAVSEAITNAVVHGYRGGPGEIDVRASRTDDDIWIVISDAGGGLQPKADRPGLGLGLDLISRLSDHLAIGPRATGGTEVRIRFGLRPGLADAERMRRGRGSVGRSGTTGVGRHSPSPAALVA